MHSVPPERGSPHHSARILLRVTRPDGFTAEYYLAGGLTIGRTLANTVVLADDDSVDRTHARVEVADDGTARLRCVEPDGSLATENEASRELVLGDGVRFRIGRTEFQCVSGRRDDTAHSVPFHAGCPHCGSSAVSRGGQAARACARCHNLVLPVQFDPHDPVPVLLPTSYGNYQAERYVARGGTSLVLQGTHEDGRSVAIKVLLADAGVEQGNAERYEQEVEMLARVRHPNVVKLLDHGTSGRYRYLALEWIEGPSLRRVITDAHQADQLPDFATAVRWFEQVVKGLAAIHAVGMVHRDLKPSNILIGPDGVARIADLGIAQRIDAGHTSEPATGHPQGTLEYMAPEQIHSPDRVDGRADLYALAVTFQELLTGTRPVGAWRPASLVNPTVPRTFDPILTHLLAPRPEDRPGDIFELLAELSTAKPSFSMSPGNGSPSIGANERAGVDSGQLAQGKSDRHTWWGIAQRSLLVIYAELSGSKPETCVARNEAVWGALLLGLSGAALGLPVSLMVAAAKQTPTLATTIGSVTLIPALFGILGGIAGVTWGGLAGPRRWGPGVMPPVKLAAILARLREGVISRWRAFGVKPFAQGRAASTRGGATIAGSTIADPAEDRTHHRTTVGALALPDDESGVMIPESIAPSPVRFPPVELPLSPATLLGLGSPAAWSLILSERATVLKDPVGAVRVDIPPEAAEEAIGLPGFWFQQRDLTIRENAWKVHRFASDPATNQAIKRYRDLTLEHGSLEAIRSVKRRGFEQMTVGIGMFLAGIGLTLSDYVIASTNPQGGEYLVFWGLGLWGSIITFRGFATFLRVDGILQRRWSACSSGPSTERREVVIEHGVDLDDGPWSPSMIGVGLALLGPVWAGLVAALNWRRLDHTVRCWPPLAAAALGSIGLIVLPFSNQAWWLILASYLTIIFLTLVPQEQSYRHSVEIGRHRGKFRLPVLLIVIGEIPVVWSAWQGNSDRGDPYLQEASVAIRQRDPDRAIAACDTALAARDRIAKSRATAMSLRGVAYGLKRDFTRALAECDAAIRLEPGLAVLYVNRGEVYLEKNEPGSTLADCTRAITIEPRLAAAYCDRAIAHLLMGSLDSAIADAGRGIALDPTNASAFGTRGTIHVSMGQYDSAIADADAALQLDPTFADAYVVRAGARIGREELNPAIADASAAIGLSPFAAGGWFHRGVAYFKSRQLDQAISDLSRAIELDPRPSSAQNYRGLALLATGARERAISDFSAVIRIEPKSSIAYNNRAMAHLENNAIDMTLADCNRAIEMDPTNSEAFLWRGAAYAIKENHTQAIRDDSEAIKLDPTSALAFNNRATAHYNLSKFDQALKDYDEAIRLVPTNPRFLANRALTHQAKGEHDAAVTDLQAALKLDPPALQQYRALLDAAVAAKQAFK